MKWEGLYRTGAALLIGSVVTLFARDIWDKIKDKWWA